MAATVSKLGRGEGTEKALKAVVMGDGRNLLHIAASGNQANICKYLVQTFKFDVNVKDAAGDTPLHIVTLCDSCPTTPTCVYLLYYGANPNVVNKMGMTPLHNATKTGRIDLLRLLISKGADVNVESIRVTPLQCAAAAGRADVVKILLENQADPNLTSYQMNHPLRLAIMANSNAVDCVRLLLEYEADPNIWSHQTTPLMSAAFSGLTEIIKCLLEFGANPNAIDFLDRTPLEFAAISLATAEHKEYPNRMAAIEVLFHATAQIHNYPVWSVDGILEYINSEDAKRQRKLKAVGKFREAEAEGYEAMRRADYIDAINWYDRAIMAIPSTKLLSKRSFCWAMLNEADYALLDASSCIFHYRKWWKGWYRAGVAWGIKGDFRKSVKAFKTALKHVPDHANAEELLQSAGRDAEAKFLEANGDVNDLHRDESDNDVFWSVFISVIDPF